MLDRLSKRLLRRLRKMWKSLGIFLLRLLWRLERGPKYAPWFPVACRECQTFKQMMRNDMQRKLLVSRGLDKLAFWLINIIMLIMFPYPWALLGLVIITIFYLMSSME